MIGAFDRQSRRKVTWRTVLGLVLVPLTAAGVLLWGLWNPTERLETVTAAVVNLDEPVTIDGQITPLGRVLAAELIGDARAADDGDDALTNFTWVLTDEKDAAAGLGDGRYATTVTIPENFSRAATSFSGAAAGEGDPETATIDIVTSDRGRLLDRALSNIVTATATSVLNTRLGAQFVGGVFVGMNEIGVGVGEAADGAKQLASGGAQLADGASQLAGGVAQLASGANALAGGAGELASGATGLAGGARQSADGASQLASGIEQYTGLVNLVVGGVIDNSAEAVPTLTNLRDLITAIPPELWPVEADLSQADALAAVQALLDEFAAASSGSADSQLVQLRTAGENLAAGAKASAAGQAQLAAGLEEYAAGAREFSGGVGSYAAGAAQAVPGATQLADGARQAADGTGELARGLEEAANRIPSYSETQSERLAETAVQPVEARGASDELFNASGVPLFVGIALWAGGFASLLMLAPLWRRTREAARGIAYLTLRSAAPIVALGAAQGAIAGLLLPPLLGYDLGQGLAFFGLSVLAGAAFSLVNQGLTALFGGFGSFVSFALLVVAFAIGVISTAPPFLQAIGDGSPIGALFDGFQAIALGTDGTSGAVFALVLWGLGGLALTGFAVGRARRRVEQ